MKKVLLHKRKYTIRDIFRFIGLAILHYAFTYMYLVVVFLIHYFVRGDLFSDLHGDSWIIFYAAILSPAINTVIHAIYSERGLAWVRMLSWTHYFFIFFAVPIVVFVA